MSLIPHKRAFVLCVAAALAVVQSGPFSRTAAAQDQPSQNGSQEEKPSQDVSEEISSSASEKKTPWEGIAKPEGAGKPESLISLNFKEADMQVVLQALAKKANVNIVTAEDVSGSVSLHLQDVTLDQALDAIAKTYGFGYEKDGNVVLVSTMDELRARREAIKDLLEMEPVVTKVIELRYLDAADVQEFLEPQLTARGRISVLEMTGQKGWSFGTAKVGGGSEDKDRKRIKRETARSKAIVITDTSTTIDRLEKILTKIDVLPKQILIETRVMEVSRDLLRDINVNLVTGTTATINSFTSGVATNIPANKQSSATIQQFAGSLLSNAITPSAFGPATTGLTPALGGAQLFFQQLRGSQFSALLQLLEEDVKTNTLSAPNVLTLSGQEASILVGEKYPILKTEIAGTTTTTQTTSLDYYQNIGIELYVVPSVGGDDHISMLIHPIVSARGGTIGTNAYPIINTREAETQVVMEKGDTIAIGGLLKDVKSKSRIGLPFLGKLPIVGPLFARTTEDVTKIDLLIFITARVVEPGMLSPDEMARLEEQYREFMRERLTKRGRSHRPSEHPAVPEPLPAVTDAMGNKGVVYQKP